MSEVKRFFADTSTRTTEECILASDFDAREKQWKEVVRELIANAVTKYDPEALVDIQIKANAMLNDQQTLEKR